MKVMESWRTCAGVTFSWLHVCLEPSVLYLHRLLRLFATSDLHMQLLTDGTRFPATHKARDAPQTDCKPVEARKDGDSDGAVGKAML